MNNTSQRTAWLAWGVLTVVILVIVGAFVRSKLPGENRPLPVIGQIPEFTLTNQNGERATLAGLRGKVWIADVIFTRCPGPCTKMTAALAKLLAALPADEPVRLVSFTSDPDNDTPEKLKTYAGKFGADGGRWWFLTGEKQAIRGLEVKDFKFVVQEKPAPDRQVPDDLFIHSTSFMLVDRQGRLRGWTDRAGQVHAKFDLEDADLQAQMLSALKQLLKEPGL